METSIKSILRHSGRTIAHQRELEEIRGETFNIFSILNVETKEEATHSAFIGELLNPNGSHMMGAIFLELFLKSIKHPETFEASSASLSKEFYIGPVNHTLKTGGRIDILLKDKNGQTISIENKIYAADQPFQIERYVNFNAPNNTVYYLTLDGHDPYDNDKSETSSKKDYQCLSYASDIISWLEECQKQAVSKPLIRESIRQYIFLLKKLTHQLSDNEMADKIIDLIEKDYLAARTITNTIEQAEIKFANLLLADIKENLENEVDTNWYVTIDEDLSKNWQGLHLRCEGEEKIWVKLEGNSRIFNTNNYMGITANIDDDSKAYEKGQNIVKAEKENLPNFKTSRHWPFYIGVDSMNFANEKIRASLFDKNKRRQIAKEVSKSMLDIQKILDRHF